MIYKLYKTLDNTDAAYVINENGSTTSFKFDLANTDYQAFLRWCKEGNTPEQAD